MENQSCYGHGQMGSQLRLQRTTTPIHTVRKVMETNGYKSGREKAKSGAYQRFEAGWSGVCLDEYFGVLGQQAQGAFDSTHR